MDQNKSQQLWTISLLLTSLWGWPTKAYVEPPIVLGPLWTCGLVAICAMQGLKCRRSQVRRRQLARPKLGQAISMQTKCHIYIYLMPARGHQTVFFFEHKDNHWFCCVFYTTAAKTVGLNVCSMRRQPKPLVLICFLCQGSKNQ